MQRTTCCVCADDSTLVEKFVLPKLPVTYSSPSTPLDGDITIDAKWGGCARCGSLQLMTLIDPNILYSTPHNDTTISPMWIKHHSEFASFISHGIDETRKITEIGGASGSLALLLNDKVREYTIMDMSEQDLKINVKFLKGNCETYDFHEEDTLVLSHVFEHLYEPFSFIKNCAKNKVRDVFISNPAMRAESVILPVDIEHTYFADDIDVQNMFERNNYTLVQKKAFGDHSFFAQFKYGFTATPVNNLRPGRDDVIVKSFLNRKLNLENVKLEGDVFIAPAGQFGQIFYYYSKYDKILGYLDNDKNKQGQRVYGTPYYTYSFDHLKTVQKPQVVLYMRHYCNEIINQIMNINPATKIITF